MFDTLGLEKINDEVFQLSGNIVSVGKKEVEFVKQQALSNSRGRARICMHANSQDDLHEMLIAISKESYITPHRHHNKVESLHVVEGEVTVVIFNEDGTISEFVELSDQTTFFYRLNATLYHTLIIHSPVLVLHEVTQGPFNVEDSDFADFSPKESDTDRLIYLQALYTQIKKLKKLNSCRVIQKQN